MAKPEVYGRFQWNRYDDVSNVCPDVGEPRKPRNTLRDIFSLPDADEIPNVNDSTPPVVIDPAKE